MASPAGQPPGGDGDATARRLDLPRELVAALSAAPEAMRRFEQLSSGNRREYVRWVSEARRDDARERRAAQTVMRLLES